MREKLPALLLVGSALVAAVILAAGLTSLELAPGQPLPAVGGRGGGAGFQIQMEVDPIFFRIVIIALFILLPVALFHYLQNPRELGRPLLIAAVMAVIAWLVVRISRGGGRFLADFAENIGGGDDAAGDAALASYDAFTGPSPWMTLAVALGIVAVVGGSLWWVLNREVQAPAEALAEEARSAVASIMAGANVKDTVTRCYFEMSDILSQQQGIRHRELLTPREFEVRMRAVSGLPDEAVSRLTRLFERVRYGARTPDDSDEQEALACLQAIVQHYDA